MRIKMEVIDSNDLRELIASKGYSIRGFAKKTKISTGYMSDIVNKNREPSPTLAGKIARGLGTSINDIFFAKSVNKSETKNERKEVTA